MARLAIVVLLVTALVATAGAVRMNEIRPIDTEPEPLSGDPDELYATAHDNTERSSHEYRWLNGSAEDEEVMYELRIDREERQLSTSFEGIEMYFESGMYYYGEPAPCPATR
ncbi:hypothetical protein D8S78_10075 [Natrialba swarupiae]|nr:hypothetical protein [Natrialba swarupiae]